MIFLKIANREVWSILKKELLGVDCIYTCVRQIKKIMIVCEIMEAVS